MNKLFYLIFKLKNELLWKVSGLNSDFPILYRSNNTEFLESDIFVIDISSVNTHLGDKLFIFPLIFFFFKNNIKYFVKCDELTSQIYLKIYGHELNFFRNELLVGDHWLVAPKWDFLRVSKLNNKNIYIDFSDVNCNYKVSHQLIYSFSKMLNLQEFDVENYLPKKPINNTSANIVIFNNYVDSGWFRLFFIKKLLNNAIYFISKNNNFYIVHIGSNKDKKEDLNSNFSYDLFFLDRRGSMSILDIMDLYEKGAVKLTVSYDNFWMHISNIYNVDCIIQFRGRFSLKNKNHHFSFVNNNFLRKPKRIEYL